MKQEDLEELVRRQANDFSKIRREKEGKKPGEPDSELEQKGDYARALEECLLHHTFVLLLDDDPKRIEKFQKMFEQHGFEYAVARNDDELKKILNPNKEQFYYLNAMIQMLPSDELWNVTWQRRILDRNKNDFLLIKKQKGNEAELMMTYLFNDFKNPKISEKNYEAHEQLKAIYNSITKGFDMPPAKREKRMPEKPDKDETYSIDTILRAIEENPNSAYWQLECGRHHKSRNEYENAFERFMEAWTLDNNNLEAIEELFLTSRKMPRKGIAGYLRSIFKQDKLAPLIQHLEKLAANDPRCSLFLGEAYLLVAGENRTKEQNDKIYDAFEKGVSYSLSEGTISIDKRKYDISKLHAAKIRITHEPFLPEFNLQNIGSVLKIREAVDKENVEHEVEKINLLKEQDSRLVTSKGEFVYFPDDIVLLEKEGKPFVYVRQTLLEGNRATEEMQKLTYPAKLCLAEKLVDATATTQIFFTHKLKDSLEDVSKKKYNLQLPTGDKAVDFYTYKIYEKLIAPMLQAGKITGGGACKAINALVELNAELEKVPEFLRLSFEDSTLCNYLIEYVGAENWADIESQMKNSRIKRVDLEHKSIRVGMYDLANVTGNYAANLSGGDENYLNQRWLDYILDRNGLAGDSVFHEMPDSKRERLLDTKIKLLEPKYGLKLYKKHTAISFFDRQLAVAGRFDGIASQLYAHIGGLLEKNPSINGYKNASPEEQAQIIHFMENSKDRDAHNILKSYIDLNTMYSTAVETANLNLEKAGCKLAYLMDKAGERGASAPEQYRALKEFLGAYSQQRQAKARKNQGN